LIEIINKPLLLHLVGYLYYWQMGFNSVFKGLIIERLAVERTSSLPHSDRCCRPLYSAEEGDGGNAGCTKIYLKYAGYNKVYFVSMDQNTV